MIAGLAAAVPDVDWESMGKFSIKNPAFVDITSFSDSDPFFLVSSFSGAPWGGGKVMVVPEITEHITGNDVKKMKEHNLNVGVDMQWPNDVKVIPDGVFDKGTRAIIIPDGFLVPGHSDGGIYIITIDNEDITKVTGTYTMAHNKDGYFYHMGSWVDMNKDGRKDFVTAKTNSKVDGGSLVWYEHPEGGLSADMAQWTEHVITTPGPDVGILVDETTFTDSIVVYAAQFFNEKFGVYRVSKKDGTLMDSYIIDDEILSAYSVNISYLNGDSQKYLMVNNHEKDEKTNGIWAYKMPSTKNMFKGPYEKTQIASTFKNAFNLFIPGMSPGFPYPMWPHAADESKAQRGHAPHIVIAGDGDYSCWIMTRTGDLTYDRDLILDAKGTVGALTWSDLDGDGWQELWMPNYDKNYVEVFRFFEKQDATVELSEEYAALPEAPLEILQ